MGNAIGLSSFVLASPFSDAHGEAWDRTAAWGYDLLEVCVEDPTRLSREGLLRHMDRTGLSVSVCGAFGPGRDVSHPDRDVREQGIEYLRTCVDLAVGVRAPMVAGPMYAPTGQTRMLPERERAEQRRRAAESLRAVAEYAGERNIALALEPLNRFETDLVNTTAQGLDLCEQIGVDNVGLLLDTFHMNIEEKSVAGAVREAGDRLFHVQVSENDRGTPGTGHVPWEAFFSALAQVDYPGAVVVESFLPDVTEIARAVSLWRPVAPSMDALASEGIDFVSGALGRSGR